MATHLWGHARDAWPAQPPRRREDRDRRRRHRAGLFMPAEMRAKAAEVGVRKEAFGVVTRFLLANPRRNLHRRGRGFAITVAPGAAGALPCGIIRLVASNIGGRGEAPISPATASRSPATRRNRLTAPAGLAAQRVITRGVNLLQVIHDTPRFA